jgi:hypothetical protein
MKATALPQVIAQADVLTPEDQLRLIAHLAEKLRCAQNAGAKPRRWREIAGAAPHPLLGEDAQAWVSRSRRESDETRRL